MEFARVSYNNMSRKVKIAHCLDDLPEQAILTIQDRPLLANGNVDEDEDVLQNDEIQLTNQAKHNAELKANIKNIADVSSSHLQAKNQGKSGILPHYDDYSYKPEMVEVEEGAVIKSRKFKKTKALGQDYTNDAPTTSKLNSEYGKQGKKTQEDSKDLLSFLEQTAEDNEPSFKRSLESEDIIAGSIDQLHKKRKMQRDLYKYAERDTEEEESFLMRRMKGSKQKAREEEKQKFSVLDAIKEENEDRPDEKTVELELNPIAHKSTDTLRQDKKATIQQVNSGTASALLLQLPSERFKVKKEQSELPEKMEQIKEQDLQRMRQEVQFMEDRQVGIGLSGTLDYLRSKGLMNQEEQVGRATDKSFEYNAPGDRVKLEYRNASGKLMKPKEAYRYICAKFHGQGSGMKKVERRKRQELQETRAQQQQNNGGQLLNMLSRHQAESGQAYMTLNFNGKK